jgi:starch synthase
MQILSPATDTTIARKYGAQSLEDKVQNKVAFQEELGWAAEPKRAILCLPAGMTDALGGELLKEILPGLLSLPINILIVGKGSAAYGTLFTQLAKEQSHRIAIIPDEEDSIRKMYAAADATLFLADPSKQPELRNALSYGAIPVSPACSVLENYDQNQESGNAFVYEKTDVWSAFAAVVRALETYRFPFDWRTIQKHGMATVA